MGDWVFWTVAAGMAAAVLAALGLALWRGRVLDDRAAADARVYRDQLKEIARDAARGVVPAAEAERLRAEVGRRLLQAAPDAPPPPLPAGPRAAGLALAAALVAGGGLAAYHRLGAPGYPDLPLALRLAASEAARAGRPSQAEAEARAPAAPAPDPGAAADPQFLALMAQLRAHVAERPDDLQGQRLLAQNEAALGNAAAARAAEERVLAILGPAATGDDHARLARRMIAAAGGIVTPQAEAALRAALAAEPDNDDALFLLGLAEMQVGRPDLAFGHWRRLIETAPPDSPWRPEVEAQIAALAAAAGQRFTPPAAGGRAGGPDADDLAAAAALTPEARAEMARGMVARLAGRLASEGGPPEDWARLVVALGVLGETGEARTVLAEARAAFAGDAAAAAVLDAAARQAGIAP